MAMHEPRHFLFATVIAALQLLAGSPAVAQAFLEAGEPMAPPQGAFALCAVDRETCGLIAPSSSSDAGYEPAQTHTTDGSGPAQAGPTITVRAIARSALEPVRIAVPATMRGEPEHREAEAQPEHTGEVTMSDEVVMALAQVINGRFNALIRYRTDQAVWGVEERWIRPFSQFGARVGDCEDYALEKRAALLEAGVPAERLRMAVVWSSATGIHAVLIVRTDDGDFVLDNAVSDVRRVDQTGYDWRSVQSGAHLLAWSSAQPLSDAPASEV